MARSHKNTIKDYVKFGVSYWYISALSTVGLLIFVYWDIIQIRYFSDFFGSAEISKNAQDLFIVGLGNNINRNFSEFLPVLVTLLLATIVAYTLYGAYKQSYYDIDVNHNYMNVDKVRTLNISLHYAVLYSAAFVAPLFFWCFYLINWFPAIAKLPLTYILGSSSLKFIIIISLVLICMILLTQIGLILTRLTIRLFKIN